MLTREYNRFRVWSDDTSVPWPMALGSCGARLVNTPYDTLEDLASSVLANVDCLIRFQVTRHFIHAANQRKLHTRIRFLMENET